MASLSMTCLACNVVFEDIDLGRNHYKTDWHRYNLKRKVAELTPVTFEKFQDRLQQQEKQVSEILMIHFCIKLSALELKIFFFNFNFSLFSYLT